LRKERRQLSFSKKISEIISNYFLKELKAEKLLSVSALGMRKACPTIANLRTF